MVLASLGLCSQVIKEMWGQLLQRQKVETAHLRIPSYRHQPISPSVLYLINTLRSWLLVVVGVLHQNEYSPSWSQLSCLCVCPFHSLAVLRVPGAKLQVRTSILFTYAHTLPQVVTLRSNTYCKIHCMHYRKIFYAQHNMFHYFNNLLSYLEIRAKDLHVLVWKESSGIIPPLA